MYSIDRVLFESIEEKRCRYQFFNNSYNKPLRVQRAAIKMSLINRLYSLFQEANALVEQAKTAEKAAVLSLKLNANEKFRQAYKVYVDSKLIINNPTTGWNIPYLPLVQMQIFCLFSYIIYLLNYLLLYLLTNSLNH